MKRALLLSTALTLILTGPGCISSQPEKNAERDAKISRKWQARINKWVPIGTTKEDACRIMKRHGFEGLDFDVNSYKSNVMSCSKVTGFHKVDVLLFFTGDRLSSLAEVEAALEIQF